MIPNIFDNYAGVKWCEIYVEFNSFLLFDFKISYITKKKTIKFDDYTAA